MRASRPVFIVGSGRSGTAALAKLLAQVPSVEMHHEYLCTHIQPVACRYAMGLADEGEVRAALAGCHGAAMALSQAGVWGDSSNKLSWIVPIVARLWPEARFAHVVRDGRKVVSSFFHKLGDECYDDAGVVALAQWRAGHGVMPPPEKRYWWPLPPPGDQAHEAFQAYDQFQRIAFHWSAVNAAVLEAAEALPAGTVETFRLEDLVAEEAELRRLFAFLGLPFRTGDFAAFRRPHNVNRPEDRLLTDAERATFDGVAGGMMQRLGYAAREEYAVDYRPAPVAASAADSCPLCGTSDLRPIYRPVGTQRDLTVHLCHGCGLVQSLPRKATAARKPAAISGGADWGNVRYGKGFRVADTMKALGTALAGRSPRRILDIGSNRGAFLAAAREAWPDAALTAIEPDSRVVGDYADLPGLSLHEAPVEEVALEAAGYDLVHCSHTLEHLADPAAVVKQIAAALAPGGVAYIEVPDLATIGRADLVEEWFIDKHLHHFARDTFALALAYADLRPVSGIGTGLHLSAVVERGPWRGPLPPADVAQVSALVDGYGARLGANRRALAGAADRIAALAAAGPVAIWGAGRILDSLVRIGGLDLGRISAVVDRELVKHTAAIHGAPLLAPDGLTGRAIGTIVIASREFAGEIAAEAARIAPGAATVPFGELLAG